MFAAGFTAKGGVTSHNEIHNALSSVRSADGVTALMEALPLIAKDQHCLKS